MRRRFTLAQIECTPGGWARAYPPPTPQQIEAAEKRWIERCYETAVYEELMRAGERWIPNQCGGCRWFATTGEDFGICWNKQSPLDGCITFEHGGCEFHSDIVAQARKKRKKKKGDKKTG